MHKDKLMPSALALSAMLGLLMANPILAQPSSQTDNRPPLSQFPRSKTASAITGTAQLRSMPSHKHRSLVGHAELNQNAVRNPSQDYYIADENKVDVN